VPDADHEAMRDLIRLHSVVRQIVTRARQHLQGVKSLPTPTPFRVQSRPLLGRGISLSA
jgi:hypothetical protein